MDAVFAPATGLGEWEIMIKPIKLHFGVAALFTVTMVVIFSVMVGYLYYSNTQLALQTASKSMRRAASDVSLSIGNLFVPTARFIDNTAFLIQSGNADLRKVDGLKFLFRQVKALPQIQGMYVGFERDGAFYHVVKVPPNMAALGPNKAKPLAGTRYALRMIDDTPGYMADSFIYLADWEEVIGQERGPVSYDPRVRPWYKIAVENRHISVSDVYIFAGSRQPGITVSQAAIDGSGDIIATVGADISLQDLATYLDEKKIGQRGRTFILDGAGNIVVQSDSAATANGQISALSNTDITIAISHYTKTGEANFTIAGADEIMATFIPFPNDFEKDWVIGVVADRAEFVQDINQATFRTLTVGLLILAFTIVAISYMSKKLTAPLRQIADETVRIREFQLSDTFSVRSNVIEINDLVVAIGAMKNSLQSFGAYVPKTLVRSIVSSGASVEIGGQQQQLTLMFSDIESFTSKSEAMAPGAIFSELSDYFRVITKAIKQHNGTIDKFIGDAVMAFWNAPIEDPAHVANGCKAMLACQAACQQLNARAAANDYGGILPVTTRFGLHTGDVMVGNVGSDDRMQYTALGAAVNLASRIEAINKQYGTNLLITEAVANQVAGQFLLRPVDLIAPAGTSVPIAIYELIGELEASSSFPATDQQVQFCADWKACYQFYEDRNWPEAASAFKGFQSAHPNDKLATLYVQRCRDFSADPPPANWNGVQVYQTK